MPAKAKRARVFWICRSMDSNYVYETDGTKADAMNTAIALNCQQYKCVSVRVTESPPPVKRRAKKARGKT